MEAFPGCTFVHFHRFFTFFHRMKGKVKFTTNWHYKHFKHLITVHHFIYWFIFIQKGVSLQFFSSEASGQSVIESQTGFCFFKQVPSAHLWVLSVQGTPIHTHKHIARCNVHQQGFLCIIIMYATSRSHSVCFAHLTHCAVLFIAPVSAVLMLVTQLVVVYTLTVCETAVLSNTHCDTNIYIMLQNYFNCFLNYWHPYNRFVWQYWTTMGVFQCIMEMLMLFMA